MFKDLGVYKKGGVITERNPEYCAVRTRIPAGMISADQLRGIADIVERYGGEGVQLTVRQTIELPSMPPDRLEGISRDLSMNGTPLGAERDEVKNVIACTGNQRCIFGNIDAVALAREIDRRLFGKEMPVKLRIAISGCPNACTSPMLNEIGVMGKIEPIRVPGMCTGCGTCVEYCQESAITIKKGISVLDSEKCVDCGVCIRSCPYDLLKSSGPYYLITVGGNRGRHPKIGRELVAVRTSSAAADVVEKVVTWVYRNAWSGRLLSDQLDDLQFDTFRSEIQNQIPDEDLFTPGVITESEVNAGSVT
ncbi:MAG TPA: 4Fe-4S binding protein [Methanoregulaceae archaeon]|nr:MAG: 4Fe-4S binding protein [Methanolinea sp.]HON81038.1 4Fe-4S binding protein [Methanoregulaceae archaeon]HPD10237.1 4Fe-4S binding protein [Methanoregulaceae archaeon]HRT14624.1 4Fe-4S binding protein [Methanoregulaceae archaeon]HRU30195.1 4Fe-4S binding protein [Methanoregulaceae archaeon]